MIKAAIVGAESRIAGELIRILLGHPDVEMTSLHAPEFSGHPVSEVHHGLIGLGNLYFTDRIDLSNSDVFFVIDRSETSDMLVEKAKDLPDTRIIVFPGLYSVDELPEDFAYGLSEVNRKTLVRGATKAVLPSLPAVESLIALYPLAYNLLLSKDIRMAMVIDSRLASCQVYGDSAMEIRGRLNDMQSSFAGDVSLEIATDGACGRQSSLEMMINCTLSLDDVMKLYDAIYDDHNFTHVITSSVGPEEVVGTNRCIVSLSKPSSALLRIKVEVDGGLRGGAGEAVHVMNLLFALHEKTGLNFKASTF